MRIGILTYHFPPEPAFLPGSLAEELAARGHEVRVLTGFPDYPGGHVYPGWRQRWHHESRSRGLTVRRVPRYRTGDGGPRGRLASWLSFATSAALVGRRYLADVDVLYVYQPPDTAFASAALLRRLGRVPVVLHVPDLWAGDVPVGAEEDRWAARARAAMLRTYRAAGAIAVTTPSLRDAVVSVGADADRVRVVLNWTEERIFQPATASSAARRLVRRDERCVFMHAGTIGPRQGLETAVRAAAALDSSMDLVLVGSGVDERRVRGLAAELGADNVRFVERRSPLDMPELYAAADYQLVVLRDLPALRSTVPAKLQAALSCGSPVVASAGGDTAALVERARAGLSCPPEDWASLADRFWLAAHIPASARAEMGRRGREAYLREMSLSAGVDRIEGLLREVAAAGNVRQNLNHDRVSHNA
ncbi:Glycosyltransferase involved in cell wall bisynthesis [Micromonospora phaseoli]|uniref:Glycosyltransferase involved in cell wall bisynthesis n=1 Tax=Micromonospora phaseoli TaxID=1144548 RepID=A0A1H6YX35_9ACTN|nr:glycosyltransferase family 4 protein [Micromonospora phaseoli]PZW00341.1 glycosyltransferase involved in cell wall biosynthesis [Micromonospora phaseoli]GIJ76819.1 glycosyltransferase WbuB [Micromonospora phaseoli]SEJ43637.1 Glycosyltransferase involved in cell wall bisynthesis [Micromonospora phaseoli]